MSNFPYISEEGKQALNNYKYHGVDGSYITPIINPFWDFCATLIPIWMAPNMVTLLGFLAIVYHYVQTIILNPSLEGDSPRWVFIVNAICLFWYMTLDAIDGKHARRTKSASPLGELFDHGCDALSTMLQTVGIIYATQLGGSWWGYTVVMIIHATFYFCIWEQYITGLMRFSAINGPTEALLVAISIHLITFFFGTDFWNQNLTEMLKLSDILPPMQVNHFAAIVTTVLSIFPMIISTFVVFTTKMSSEERKKKGHPLKSFFPFLWLFVNFLGYVIISPYDILRKHPVFIYSIFGTVTAYLVTRLLIARVCKEPCEALYLIEVPLPLLILNALASKYGYPSVDEVVLFILYIIYVIILYCDMTYGVIHSMTEHLGIYAFSLKKRVNEKILKRE